MKRTMRMWGLVLAAALIGGTAWAQGSVPRVVITEGQVQPRPIAVLPLTGDVNEARIGADIAAVISDNLQRSALFAPIPANAWIETPDRMGPLPRFGDWRLLNAEGLVTGRVTAATGNAVRVEFRLWDPYTERQLTGMVYTTARDQWRRIAHIISDQIYKQMTGEDGYFDTRIVYISENGPKTNRIKRLAIMDQDGHNHRFLTPGDALVLTPRFSPTTHEITYLAYYNNEPRVYLFNLLTGEQELVGNFPGMTFAPRFSPDGNAVIMSMARDGNTEIYTMDLRTRSVRRLTNHPAIDTSPSFSPDGRRVVFNSDRAGSQQLYTMDSDGNDVKRISFNEGRYATPVWSPRGDLIAFTKIFRGRFFIGVMRTDGSGERLLTESFLDEGPTWAPNGRVLLFYRQTPTDSQGQGGATRIFSIDLTGYNEREVITPVDASDPAWSPPLPLN